MMVGLDTVMPHSIPAFMLPCFYATSYCLLSRHSSIPLQAITTGDLSGGYSIVPFPFGRVPIVPCFVAFSLGSSQVTSSYLLILA